MQIILKYEPIKLLNYKNNFYYYCPIKKNTVKIKYFKYLY